MSSLEHDLAIAQSMLRQTREELERKTQQLTDVYEQIKTILDGRTKRN